MFDMSIQAKCYCTWINVIHGSYGWSGAGSNMPSSSYWLCSSEGKKQLLSTLTGNSIDYYVQYEYSEVLFITDWEIGV